MDNSEAPNSHDAIPVRDPDEPYAGLPGQTRYESVHLVERDGSVRSIAVCRSINVATHPELKARALTGLLHRLDDGRELALSFVYHDPDARKFALVVPTALAHLELKEWSRLMAEVAEDTRCPVPAYVKDATTVLGLPALARFIETEIEEEEGRGERPTPAELPMSLELREREHLVSARERELAEQERALIRMAEGLTAREGELNRRQEQLDSAGAELQLRKVELEQRMTEAVRDERRRLGSWQEVGVAANSDNEATVVSDISRRVAVESAMREASSLAMGGRSHPPPLPMVARSRSGPPPLPHKNHQTTHHATPPPLALRREAEPARPKPRSTQPPPLPTHDALVTEPTDREPEVAAPPQFSGGRTGQLALKLADDELWLYAHLDEGHASAFRHGADLMLQYVEIEAYPLVLMSLVDQRPEPFALRHVLDGYAESDLRVLEHLSRSFRARVALYVEGLYIETVTIAMLREGVAQAMLEKLGERPSERPSIGPTEASARLIAMPPPLWNDDLPFGPARREAPTTVTVMAAVEQLAAWMRPEKLAEATLTYSVPEHVIDATVRRVVRAAIAFGVGLPDQLLEIAVAHGAASDESAAIQEQLRAFQQRIEQHQNDLSAEATRANWQRLLAAAEARGIEVDAAVQTLALSVESEQVSPSDGASSGRLFENLSASELKANLQDPAQRLEAIRELCMRGHASAIEQVIGVLDGLRPTEAMMAVAQLMSFGETAGDALIGALSGPNPAVRQAAALALGRLKLRRALVPMVRQLELEETPSYTEIARAFGDFGAPALRSVVRAIPGAQRGDRLVLALAHLANHGSAREVEKLENDADTEVSQAARKAMARRSRMEWEDLAVREQRSLTDGNPAARLSQAFYAEAAKVVI